MGPGKATPAGNRRLGLLVGSIVVACLAAGLALSATNATEADPGIFLSVGLVGVIGAVLVAKRPDHPISWLLSASAVAGAVSGLSAGALPPGATEASPLQAALGLVGGPGWMFLLATMLVWIPLLFPTGRPPSPRWGWVGWVTLACLVVMSAMWFVQEDLCTGGDDACLTSIPNPIGIEGMPNPETSPVGAITFGVLGACSVAALLSAVVRFRRAGPVERQQMKWFLFSVAAFAIIQVAIDVVWLDLLARSPIPGVWLVQQVVWLMIPMSIAVAILRFRLYDLDRLVSRSATYAVLTGVLVSVYAATVFVLTQVLPIMGDLPVAAATLVVAALFRPLRSRLQRWMDRRFNRRRYDAEQVSEGFAASLRGQLELGGLEEQFARVVTATMQPSVAGIWIRAGEEQTA